MKPGRVIGGLAGTLAGVAGANTLLEQRAGPLAPPLPDDPTTFRWRGMDVSVTEGGTPSDPDVVLLHGMRIAGTSREFRAIYDRLTRDYHVIAPDFPGFGRSERPPLVYSARLYEDFVREFVREQSTDAACVAASLSGAYAATVASDVDLRQLLLIAPTTHTTGRDHWLARGALRLPLVGTGLFNALASKPALRYWQHQEPLGISGEMDGAMDYAWSTLHQPGARYAPASLLSGFLDAEIDLGATIADTDLPVTLVWGRDADAPSLRTGRQLAERANRKLVVIDQAGAMPHVEQSDAFSEVLEEELTIPERVDGSSGADAHTNHTAE